MNPPHTKAALLLMAQPQGRRQRLLRQLAPVQAASIEKLLVTAEALRLSYRDFTEGRLPLLAFQCKSVQQVLWLRHCHADKQHQKITGHAKRAFMAALAASGAPV